LQGNATDVAAGIVQVAQKLVSAGIPVLFIRSTPVFNKLIFPCMTQMAERDPTSTDLSACSVPREEGLRDGVIDIAARMYPMMRRLSFDDILCPGDTCPPAIGNVILYGDAHHLIKAAAQSLADALQEKLLEKAPHLASEAA
jgi:DNA-binding transcriptional LysR family regulator